MHKVEDGLARIFVVAMSAILAFAIIDAGANFYLWNIASEEDFQELASVNQIKERYGDDFYIDSVGSHGHLFSPHHYLGYGLAPNLRHRTNLHNSYGYRGEEFSLHKPDGSYRIVAVGGSTTYGIDIEDFRHSYPYQLGEYLRQQGHENVEVINAGVVGYTSHQTLINIQFRVLPLQPDLVVIYQGYNDIHSRFVYPFSECQGDNSGHVAPYSTDIVMPPIWEYSTALRILGIRSGKSTPYTTLDWGSD